MASDERKRNLGELINVYYGAKLMQVPYNGFAPVITASLGNEVQVPLAPYPGVFAWLTRRKALPGCPVR